MYQKTSSNNKVILREKFYIRSSVVIMLHMIKSHKFCKFSLTTNHDMKYFFPRLGSERNKTSREPATVRGQAHDSRARHKGGALAITVARVAPAAGALSRVSATVLPLSHIYSASFTTEHYLRSLYIGIVHCLSSTKL